MFPENLVQACFQQIRTDYEPRKAKTPSTTRPPSLGDNSTTLDPLTTVLTTVAETLTNSTENTTAATVDDLNRKLRYVDGINVFG
jgi:hypothetical protein